jgi:glycosyltransferase 2 family protein
MKKLLSLAVSLLILGVIYYRIDLPSLLNVLKSCSLSWLAAGLFMFVPTTLVTGLRLKMLSPEIAGVTTRDALKLILAACSLNMILPAKMGDIAKGYFIAGKGGLPLANSLSLVVYEKTCDMLSLLLWCVLGLFCYGRKDLLFILLAVLTITGLIAGILMLESKAFAAFGFRFLMKISPGSVASKIEILRQSWTEMVDYLNDRKSLRLKIAAMSISIWFMHLLQIWFFIRLLGGSIPIVVHMGLTPLAIFAGLIPFTFAGVGTRDAALIFFLKDYLSLSVAAALGILCTFRYIVPAIAGLPFLKNYVVKTCKDSAGG